MRLKILAFVMIAACSISTAIQASYKDIGIFGDYFFNEEYNTLHPRSRYVISMPGATSLRRHQAWISQEYSYWRELNTDYSELTVRGAYGITDYFEVEGGYARGEHTDEDKAIGRLRFCYPNHKHATAFGFIVSRENVKLQKNEKTVFSVFGSKMFFPNYSVHLAATKADGSDDKILWQLGTDLAVSDHLNLMFVASKEERSRYTKYDIGGRFNFGKNAETGYLYLNRNDLSSDFYQKEYNFGLAVFF